MNLKERIKILEDRNVDLVKNLYESADLAEKLTNQNIKLKKRLAEAEQEIICLEEEFYGR